MILTILVSLGCFAPVSFAADKGADKFEPIVTSQKIPTRDTVGDLNAGAVEAGEFPDSIKIPGNGDVSLAIGGFVKTVAIFDSDAENMGADLLPVTWGTRRSDTEGGFSLV